MAYEIFIGDVAFGAALGFLAGIFSANLHWNVLVIAGTFLFAGCIAGSWLAIQGKLEKVLDTWLVGAGVTVFVAIVIGAFYYRFFIDFQKSQINLPMGKSVSFLAIVSDEPVVSGKYILLNANAEKPLSGAITIFAPLGSSFQYGDELQVAGEIAAPKMAGDDPAVFPKKLTFVAAHKGFWLREQMIDFKLAILKMLNEALLPDEAALLGGETLGGTNGMGMDLKNEMSASGTSYVVSMYGYKISMIVFFLEETFKERIARRVRFFILIAAIILFVMMAGGEASVVRAAIMSILVIAAQAAGRVFDSRNALALTAAGMALWDPMLVGQPAFQLSFLSIIGIKYLSQPLKKLFRWEKKSAGIISWREAVIIAVASLLPIIPIIANVFGDFSWVSFPSNILISVAVLPAMIAGVALALAGSISYYLAFLIAKFAGVILAYQLMVIRFFAAIAPAVPLTIPFNSAVAFVVYYAALAWFVYYHSENYYAEN